MTHGDLAIGAWHFQYSVPSAAKDDRYRIGYEYPRASGAEIKAAVDAMRQSSAQLASSGSPFKATLVFAHPISVSEFTTLAQSVGIAPTANILRVVDPQKGVLKVGIPPEFASNADGRVLVGQPAPNGKPVDPAALDRYLGGRKDVQVVGVISTDVSLDKATYDKVRADSRVFAIDTLEQLLTNEVRRIHPDASIEQIVVQGSILYPALEDLGIAPKAQQP